ncbi:prostaglandin E2 receptor EP4 subtype-like [Saccostrea echinata]|uniref:prostaglandin E2 receptor EP4 subtype-like n=1 Tax=Saccostrea echinata TaxID=191078 RepID=UPI002A81FAF2|nr:prostaglandin E2 receptor EP4 subtype-like [Saccostrea echinata]
MATKDALTDNISTEGDAESLVINAVPAYLLFAFGVGGNIIALVVLLVTAKTHNWRPFYRYVCGLAITDGGGLLISVPVSLSMYASELQRELSPVLCNFQMFWYMFTLMSSAMIVCGMSFDRFFAIFYPFYYNKPHKEIRTNIVVLVIWVLSALISSLPFFGLGSSRKFYPGTWCFLNFIETTTEVNRINSIIYASIGVVIVLATWIFNIAVIVYFVYKRYKRESTWSGWKDAHVIIFLMTVVVLFTSCWFPLMVNILGHATFALLETAGKSELLFTRLSITNSVVDPWLYIIFRREIYSALLSGVKRLCPTEKESQTDSAPNQPQSLSTGNKTENVSIETN